MTKNEKHIRLAELTGQHERAKSIVTMMFSMPMFTNLLGDDGAVQIRALAESRFEELVLAVAESTADLFDESTLDALITFYESPIGKKLIEVTPLMQERGFKIWQAWGERLVESPQGRAIVDAAVDRLENKS